MDALHLVGSLTNQDAIQVAVVRRHLGQRGDIARIHQLTDARGVVHRLMLQGRQTVVEHGIGHVQVRVFELGATQLVLRHLDIRLLQAFAPRAVVKPVAIVEHIVGRHNHHQQHQQQDDGNALVRLRLLHRAAVVGQRVVGTHLLEQLGVHLIIIRV